MFKGIALLALLIPILAVAKSYTFTITEPAVIGNSQLKAGDYHVKVDGSQAVVMDSDGSRLDVTAMVESVERKFDWTSVGMSKADGAPRIVSVEFGGTRIKVVFQPAAL